MYNYELIQVILLLSYNNYIKYNSLINVNSLKELHKEIYYLFTTIKELQENTPANYSVDEFAVYFYTKYPAARDNAAYEALLTQAKALNISELAADKVLHAVQQRASAVALSEAAFKFTQGYGSPDEIKTLYEAFNGLPEDVSDDTEYVTTDLEELVTGAILTPGLRWRLDCLNKSLGSLRKGDFGFLFARPESGKTTFIASEVSFMLTQTDKPIIHFNNEEQGSKVMLRYYQAFFGVDLQTLIGNAAYYKMEWAKAIGPRLKLVDNAMLSKANVEKILKDISDVSLIVFDQIDKIKGFEADRNDLALGARYQWARELAKTYAPTIGICQADGSGEGQKWLTMQNVADAKTAKQAEADWIAGLGKTHDHNEESIRFINISKNKLSGDKDTRSDLRHGRFEVLIQPNIARYKDIVSYE